ncbi:MAG: aldo/keto reductase [Chloroflexi bacterium]|nr:aldo/keto reductase [Chloroflexota bacterium]
MAVSRRPFGSTGLEVSSIGFGCGPTAGLIVRGSPGERAEAVARALALGIDYFDTAPIYGNTLSEQHLGVTLHELGATVTLASKVALDLLDLEDIHAAVLASVEASLKRLKRDALDVIQLHNRVGFQRAARSNTGVGALITLDDALRVADAFDELRRQGKVRATGCCAYGGDPPVVARVLDSGRFDAVLVQYSLANQSAFGGPAPEGGLDYAGAGRRAAHNGMAPIAIRTLEAGKLASEPEDAIRFVLRRLEIATAVIGFSTIAHVEQAARAATMDAC